MTTFTGRYLQEPADLQVCVESDLIAVGAKAADVDPGQAETFAELQAASAGNYAKVVEKINGDITAVESEIESYARRRGYAIPLAPVDGMVRKLAGRMLWVDLRQQGKALTASAAEQDRQTLRRELENIANGTLLLSAAKSTDKPAQSSHVYRINDAASRDTTGTVQRMSRKSMGGW
jgi:hypothetical protein